MYVCKIYRNNSTKSEGEKEDGRIRRTMINKMHIINAKATTHTHTQIQTKDIWLIALKTVYIKNKRNQKSRAYRN